GLSLRGAPGVVPAGVVPAARERAGLPLEGAGLGARRRRAQARRPLRAHREPEGTRRTRLGGDPRRSLGSRSPIRTLMAAERARDRPAEVGRTAPPEECPKDRQA